MWFVALLSLHKNVLHIYTSCLWVICNDVLIIMKTIWFSLDSFFFTSIQEKEVENWYIYILLFRISALQITQILSNTNLFTVLTILSSHMWYDSLYWCIHLVVNPDPEIRSSRRVHIAVLYHSTRPDLQISICHCIQYWIAQSYKHMLWHHHQLSSPPPLSYFLLGTCGLWQIVSDGILASF